MRVSALGVVRAAARPWGYRDRIAPPADIPLLWRWLINVANHRLFKSEAGVTAIEYGLIAALVAVVIVTAVTLVGTNLTTVFDKVSAKL